MGVYLAAVAFLVLFYALLRRVKAPAETKAVVYTLAAAVLLSLVLGLRHPSMGVDLGYGEAVGYLASFSEIGTLLWRQVLAQAAFQNYEWGFILLNKLLYTLGLGEQGLLFVCALLSLLPIGAIICRFSANCRTSFLIYLGLPAFLICFSGLRQGIALGISFYAYRFAVERRLSLFLLTTTLACLFHSTAVVALLVYPVAGIRPDGVARWCSVAVLGVLFVFRSELWNALVHFTGRSIPAVHNGSVALMLLFWGIYGYLILFSREKGCLFGLINLQYLACCALVFAEVSNVAQRVGYYFMLYLTLSLPELLREVRRNRGIFEYSLHWLAVVGGFLLFGIYQLRRNTWAMAWPYAFFWETIG